MDIESAYRGKHKILNPATGRYVNKTGKIGKTIKKSKCSYLSAKKKASCKKTAKRGVKKSAKKTTKKSPKKIVKKSPKKTVKKSPKKTVKKSPKKTKQTSTKRYVSASGKSYSKCWPGYKQQGWKMKNGRRVPNCVKI